MEVLHYKGYTLRKFSKNDFEEYYIALTNMDDEVVRFTGSQASYAKSKVKEYFEMILKQENRVDLLIVNPKGKIIGESVVNDFNKEVKSANFRIVLFNTVDSNKGIGTWAIESTLSYAFDVLNLQKIELDVFSFNERAIHTYKKIGFEVDDVVKNSIKDGEDLADDILMSLSKETWNLKIKQKLSSITYDNLEDISIEVVYLCFVEAFKDYILPMNMTLDAFKSMLFERGYNASLSIGIFVGGHLCGFILNGTDESKPTQVYDISTGLVAHYRHKGLSTTMFKHNEKQLIELGYEKYYLEVISSNYAALNLYSKQDFEISRELRTYELQINHQNYDKSPNVLSFESDDLDEFHSFRSFNPSWQNDDQATLRSQDVKLFKVIQAEHIVGFAAMNNRTGTVLQFCIDEKFRRQGLGTDLLKHLIHSSTNNKIRFINIEKSNHCFEEFLKTMDFKLKIRQFEMVKQL